jgi:hypothetical protein
MPGKPEETWGRKHKMDSSVNKRKNDERKNEINKCIMIEAPKVVPNGSDCLFVSRDGKGDQAVNNLPEAIKADLDALAVSAVTLPDLFQNSSFGPGYAKLSCP